MLRSEQVRAARALLRWSAQKLADESGVSWKKIQRMESQNGVPSATARNVEKIRHTLENAGVVFIDENGGGSGARLRDRGSGQ